MSAVEWLPFISPFVWILLILNGLALLPLKLKARLPTRVKLTLVFCIIALIGWLTAMITVHVMAPTVRVNLLVLSKLLLVPSLTVLTITLIRHLIQGENVLVTLLKGLARFLKPCLYLLTLIAPAILQVIASAFSTDDQEDKLKKRREREQKDKIHINWKGEYSGEDDWNKY